MSPLRSLEVAQRTLASRWAKERNLKKRSVNRFEDNGEEQKVR